MQPYELSGHNDEIMFLEILRSSSELMPRWFSRIGLCGKSSNFNFQNQFS